MKLKNADLLIAATVNVAGVGVGVGWGGVGGWLFVKTYIPI